MSRRLNTTQSLLLTAGFLAFAVAVLSIVDMFLPRPYDGVVLEADVPGQLIVREVSPGSGAERAQIVPGDQIVGISRNILRSTAHAGELISRRQIGEHLPYLLRNNGELREVSVELGRRTFGNPTYLYACFLGFSFFFIGLFVFWQQPQMRAAHIFYALGCLFLLFLVCRLRPASYSQVDTLVLTTGTGALLLLPPCFLHFFLLFPRPIWLRPNEPGNRSARHRRWSLLLITVYALPSLAFLASYQIAMRQGVPLPLISGAPVSNWWILAAFLVAGLICLAYNSTRLKSRRMRSGVAWILAGSIFGLVPFLALVIAFPSFLHQGRYLLYGLLPIALVPLTFAYAIIRFQLLDIRVILRKSLLYTVTSALLTAFYAVGIAAFNTVSNVTHIASSRYFPILFALTIALLFEPIRRRLQILVDGFFFAERSRIRQTMLELGEALTAQVDPMAVVRDLVEKLPAQLGLHFAALYLIRNDQLTRVAGPRRLPEELSLLPMLHSLLSSRERLLPIEGLQGAGNDPDLDQTLELLRTEGVEVVGDLASRRRRLGLVLLSGKVGQIPLDREELRLLEGLLRQTAIALEAGLLLEEKTQQAELEREMEIAADVQTSLLPSSMSFADGWGVAAACQPAKHVGGDFYTALPAPGGQSKALVYGDVSGKSVSGALVMMAAHEILHSLAMTQTTPEQLFDLANERLYRLGQRKGFVALCYLSISDDGRGLRYVLAGQPQPLLRRADGTVEELPLPNHRLPLGALLNGEYQSLEVPVAAGELVLGYSDGVVDARAASGEFFGTDRLSEIVSQSPADPQTVVDRVLESIDRFTNGTEPYDDVTLVAIAVERSPSSAGPTSTGRVSTDPLPAGPMSASPVSASRISANQPSTEGKSQL